MRKYGRFAGSVWVILILVGFTFSIPAEGAEGTKAERIAAVEAKLKLLEQAREAGILEENEYRSKKEKLQAELAALREPEVDKARREKLKVLEAAYKAGLLSKEEYERKKAEILKGTGAGKSSGSARGAALATYRDPKLGYVFQYPSSWTLKPFAGGSGVSLTKGKEEDSINVMTMEGSGDAKGLLLSVLDQIRGQWKNFSRDPAPQATKAAGVAAFRINFRGLNPKGRDVIACMTSFRSGSCGYLILLTAGKGTFREALPVYDSLLTSFRFKKTTRPRRKGKLYRHVVGFSFFYPEGWTVKEQGDFLQLVPPDPVTTPDGPAELYFIIGDSVAGEGITKADDPRVIAYLDTQVRSISPAFQRTGTTAPVKMASGQGTVINWRGTNPRGQPIQARAFACILGNYGIALLGIGFKGLLDKRDKELRWSFSTYGFSEGKKDPRLVGTWRMISTRSLSNDSPFETDSSKARSVSETKSTLEFRSDGTWRRKDVSEFIAMGSGVTVAQGPRETVSEGKWYAGNGSLFFLWKDDTWQDCSYTLENGALKLKFEDSLEVWKRTP